jgi:Putative heavy-metal-binding
MRPVLLALALTVAPIVAYAETPLAIDPAIGVPVFPGSIRDRPYTVIGEVRASAGKMTPFSNDADQAKLYRALWKRAQALGADAVINVRYGDAHVSAFSWGKTNAAGTAIRFVTTDASP